MLIRALALLLGFPSFAVAADEEILMVFRDKPPYSYVEQGLPRGFLYERTVRIVTEAGLKVRFMEMPPKRIFKEIEDDARAICSFGWYKIPARERYARFSASIHQDRPHVVLASRDSAPKIRQHASLRDLFADASLTLAVADGVSYGADLDLMIARFAGRTDRSLVAPLQLARMIGAQRADFMLIDQEDLDLLMNDDDEFKKGQFIHLAFPDAPPGLRRHILCSKKVDAETMTRIDAAISRVGKVR